MDLAGLLETNMDDEYASTPCLPHTMPIESRMPELMLFKSKTPVHVAGHLEETPGVAHVHQRERV